MSIFEQIAMKLDMKKLACKKLSEANPDQKYFEVDFSPSEHFSFGLLVKQELDGDADSEARCEQHFEWHFPGEPNTAVRIRQRRAGFLCLDDFREVEEIGSEIDYTGGVCVWPSEETLGYFLLSRREMFRGKRVLNWALEVEWPGSC